MPKHKVVVEEFARFLNDTAVWNGDIYYDNEDEDLYTALFAFNKDETRAIVPGTLVNLGHLDGDVLWQGAGEEPKGRIDTMVRLFHDWKKKQTVTCLVFEIPNEKVGAVKAAVEKILRT